MAIPVQGEKTFDSRFACKTEQSIRWISAIGSLNNRDTLIGENQKNK